MSNDSCPTNVTDDKINDVKGDELVKGLATLMNSMGIQSCKQFSAAGAGFSIIPPIVAAVGATGSVGCEQLNVLAQTVSAYQSAISCILNETGTDTDVKIIQKNDITIEINGILDFPIQINQTNSENVKITNSLSNTTEAKIQDTLSNFTKSFLDSMSKSKTGFLGSNQGQKNIQAFQDKITQNVQQSAITKTIGTLKSQISQDNRSKIILNGYDPISYNINKKSAEIIINQQNYVDYQAYNVVNNLLKTYFSTDEGVKLISSMKSAEESESQGIDSFLNAFLAPIIAIIVLIIGGMVLFGGGSISSVFKYIIPICIIASIIVAIIFGLKKPPQYVVLVTMIITAVLFSVLEIYIITKKIN